jgi:hypothetical protein
MERESTWAMATIRAKSLYLSRANWRRLVVEIVDPDLVEELNKIKNIPGASLMLRHLERV